MNRKQLILMLVLVVVLGGLALFRQSKQHAAWNADRPGVGHKLLPDFPVNDIAGIHLRAGTNELDVVKSNDLWRVTQRGGYPADFAKISEFLLKIKDLKVVQTETVAAGDLPELDLAPPGPATNAATTLEFADAAGKPLRTVWLGKMHRNSGGGMGGPGEQGWPDGRYVLPGGSGDTVAVLADSLETAVPEPESWLRKDFFKVESATSLAVTFPAATNSWELTRTNPTAPWHLTAAAPGEVLDPAKLSAFTSPFASPSFTDVAVGPTPAATGLEHPTVIGLHTEDGFDYTVKIGNKTNSDYYATVAVSANLAKERTPAQDEKPDAKAKLDQEFQEHLKTLETKLTREKGYAGWVYLMPSWTVDPLLRTRADLLATNAAPAAAAAETNAVPVKGEK